jgi:hypothetical protein
MQLGCSKIRVLSLSMTRILLKIAVSPLGSTFLVGYWSSPGRRQTNFFVAPWKESRDYEEE